MDSAKEEIRARLAVEDVVGQYIELKRAGRNLKGRSPWGVDKTPSFMVSPEKGIWHDFSANKGGDIFTFVMEVEGISFREALEKLAQQAGVELTRYTGGDAKVAERKARARECLELACKFYQVCLVRNKKVCEYVFYKRNLNRETVKEFRIGFAPSSKNVLVDFLKKKGFDKQAMEDAGLLNQYGGDLFRGRMMVPFIDGSNVIGFTGRILDNGEPKYLNTPETYLFNKGRFVFGLTQAREAIRKSGFVVIVEGNMDVISSHQAGVKEAVATSGTAMTEMHLKALSRLTDDIRLAYDGDEAGVKAAERAIMLAGGLGINLSVISGYGEAKDPDELIQQDPKLWQEAVQKHKPAVEWLLEQYEGKLDLSSGTDKKIYAETAMRVINMLKNKVEQKHYKQMVSKKLGVDVGDLEASVVTKRRLKQVKTQKQKPVQNKLLKELEYKLRAIALFGGSAGQDVKIDLPEDEDSLSELEMVFERSYGKMNESDLKKEATDLSRRYGQEQIRQRLKDLQAQVVQAEEDEELQEELLKKITALQKQLL